MGALIYVLFIAFLVGLFLYVSKSFRGLPKSVQLVVLVVVALAVAILATFELFIYLHHRWVEFLVAIRAIPWWVVALVFVAIAVALFVLFRFLGTKVDSRGISVFVQRYITPQAKDFIREMKSGEGTVERWRFWTPGFWRRPAEPDSEDDDTKRG